MKAATGAPEHGTKHSEVDATSDVEIVMATKMRERSQLVYTPERWNAGTEHKLVAITPSLYLFGGT